MKYVFFALCMGASLSAGVADTTMVYTPTGAKIIGSLRAGDSIIALKETFLPVERAITSAEDILVPECIEITTVDGSSIKVSHNQKFYVPNRMAWINAVNLTMGDALLLQNFTMTRIASIKIVKEPTKMSFITVDRDYNFFAGSNGIWIHNGPLAGLIGYWGVKVVAYVGICSATTVAVGAAVGTLPVSGPVTATVGSVATAGLGVAAPVSTTGALVSAGAMGTGTTVGTAIASSIQSTAIIGATVAKIEATASGVGCFLGSLPFLP